MRNRYFSFVGVVICGLVLFSAQLAFADCTLSGSTFCNGQPCAGETRPIGHIAYNDDFGVMQVCTSSGWKAMAGGDGGGGTSVPTCADGDSLIAAAGNWYCSSAIPPVGCSNIGDECADGSIFAGDTNMYVTDVNQSGSAKWANSQGTNNINPDSTTDGQANHDNRSGALSGFPAFAACENLERHYRTDWYLPAEAELEVLYTNRVAIGIPTATYWSSTEGGASYGRRKHFSTGATGNGLKELANSVRCVRRE